MKKFFLIFAVLFFFLFLPVNSQAQAPRFSPSTQTYYKAQVKEIVSQKEEIIAGQKNYFQEIKVKILDGNEKNKEVTIDHTSVQNITPLQNFKKGNEIVLLKNVGNDGKTTYSIMDSYRLNWVIIIAILFFILVILISGKKGLGSILGLIVSIIVILKFIVPQILNGNDPVLISIIGCIIIMIVSIYLAHGFSRKTHVAVVSTAITLTITGILSVLFVNLTHLTGLGSEDTYLLQFGDNPINLKGLLLGGMIIGALGVLDDITNAQSAAIFEISKVDKKLKFIDLAEKGFNIGKEHVSSLVNTLVLAYAGASLGLFIIFVLNPANQPYWVILNSEIITEEIIRTLSGSFGLVLAVPITTILASVIASRINSK